MIDPETYFSGKPKSVFRGSELYQTNITRHTEWEFYLETVNLYNQHNTRRQRKLLSEATLLHFKDEPSIDEKHLYEIMLTYEPSSKNAKNMLINI